MGEAKFYISLWCLIVALAALLASKGVSESQEVQYGCVATIGLTSALQSKPCMVLAIAVI